MFIYIFKNMYKARFNTCLSDGSLLSDDDELLLSFIPVHVIISIIILKKFVLLLHRILT